MVLDGVLSFIFLVVPRKPVLDHLKVRMSSGHQGQDFADKAAVSVLLVYLLRGKVGLAGVIESMRGAKDGSPVTTCWQVSNVIFSGIFCR